MKFKSLLAAMLIVASSAGAQTADPVVMTINGNPVLRSEFEYSYNKNNSETVVDKKSVADYVPLFVNYKLKVLAAEAAGIDTTSAFRKEFLSYRDQQVRPSFINDDDVEAEARKIYKETQTRIDSNGGLVRPSHILLMLKQNATQAEQDAAKLREKRTERREDAQEDAAELRERLKALLEERNFVHRHLLNAFPHLRQEEYKSAFERIQEHRKKNF